VRGAGDLVLGGVTSAVWSDLVPRPGDLVHCRGDLVPRPGDLVRGGVTSCPGRVTSCAAG